MTLEVQLAHRFRGFTLDLAFAAPPGVTALFGQSGAGKTTIVNAVAGLLHPDRGRISIDGVILLDTARRVAIPTHRRRIGYVFQEGRLFRHMTVRQNILYGAWFAGQKATDSTRIIDLMGIGALLDRRPGTLSGGEKQRVALARAILSQPRMLLMDEPLSALDAARKAEVLPYLERLRDETRLPILYVSHSVAEVARLATTVVLIDKGRLVRAGPAGEVLSDPAASTALGPQETGAIVVARVVAHADDGLTRLESSAGPLWLPQPAARVGDTLRIRILAQDVMLALDRPQSISALNVVPCVVREVLADAGPSALVQLSAGDDTILARITRRSAVSLALAPGTAVFAIIKAVSVARDAPGRADPYMQA
ncbi:MAG: molybdenum ABC transporter ATP-binding protein [Pseudomonadota bacterium]